MMEREKGIVEKFIRGGEKVRKRGSSSSSTSTILQNVKLKRAIMAGRRGGSTTPVQNWKMSSETLPAMASSPYPPSLGGIARGNRVSISARKLAATLWELHQIPTSSTMTAGAQRDKNVKKSSRNGDNYKTRSRDRTPLQSHFLPPHLSDPSHSPSSLIETRDRAFTPSSSQMGLKVKSGESGYNLTTSTELLKILNRIWRLEQQHSSSVSLVSALRSELEHVRSRMRELVQEQRTDRHQIDSLMKRIADEKMIWRTKEQDKVKAAILTAREELEDERKFRRKVESLNKKLARELDKTKGALGKALQDFERERNARELMEEVCDELAREIGEDKAEVEELKRESAKVWEEVEEERKMLQMAEVWREERVQMKLAEARLELEEKNETLDKLKSELEAFLRAKRANDLRTEVQNKIDAREAELQRDSMNEVKTAAQEMEDEDSADSDLHSIELNRETWEDNTIAYKWSYATGVKSEETKGRRSDQRATLNEESKGRKSSEQRGAQLEDQMESSTWHGSKAQILDRLKGNYSLDRERVAEGIEWDFTSSSQWFERNIVSRNDGGQDHGKSSKHANESLTKGGSLIQSEGNGVKQDLDKARKFRSVGGSGRDHLVGSALASAQGSASPTRQWNHHWPPPDPGSARFGRSEGGSRENTLKSKLLEASLEGQQTRVGGSKYLEYYGGAEETFEWD